MCGLVIRPGSGRGGDVLTACVAARVAAMAAVEAEDVLVWLGREAHAHLVLGSKDIGINAEFCAGAAFAAGRPAEAVRLFAAGRVYLRRVGLAWPFVPTTPSLVAQAEDLLGATAFAAAYRDGEQRRIEDLLQGASSVV